MMNGRGNPSLAMRGTAAPASALPAPARPALGRLLGAGLAVIAGAGPLVLLAPPALHAQGTAPASQIVGVVPAAMSAVATGTDFIGRVEARERADIRARVTGELLDVAFAEGGQVKEGDTLFEIEKPPFQAAVQQARGALVQAQAQYKNASAQRQRGEQLVRSNTVSRSEQDQRIAAELSAQGQIVIADAALQTAQLNLDYATIKAPISGRIGRSAVTRGNLIGPDKGVLTTIVATDPMWVVFPVSQREFLRLQRSGQNDPAQFQVVLRFADGSVYDQPGKIDFVDNTVSRETDTVMVRASFANPNNRLADGQLVTASVQRAERVEQLVIRQAAVIADQEGTYVFIVENGKAAVRRVKLGPAVGRDVVVLSGLEPGTPVVVEGLQTLRAGMAVTATPVEDSVKQIGG